MSNIPLEIGKLEVVKIGSDISSQFGLRIVNHKGNIYVSGHGHNIFSGSIYDLNNDKFIYPYFTMNQCWGYNIVSNGLEMAISAHCNDLYTGYVEMYPSRKRLMKGENQLDACGFDIAWFDKKWWVACRFKIWNSDIGFIRDNIDMFPLFYVDKNFITLTYIRTQNNNRTLYYNKDYGYYEDKVILNKNTVYSKNKENIIYGNRQEELYEYKDKTNNGTVIEYRNGKYYEFIGENRYFGSSVYMNENFTIIGDNQSIHINYFNQNLETHNSIRVEIPSYPNTTFTYYYQYPFLYIGSYSTLEFIGTLYKISIVLNEVETNNIVIINNKNSEIANKFIVINFIIVFFIIICLSICIFYFIKCKTNNLIIKKKKEDEGEEIRIVPILYYENIYPKINNDIIYEYQIGSTTPDQLKEMEKERINKSNQPGAYYVH